ncbi:integrase [Gemmatimonadetes bacterium T265]|nr:integrase [Gemmatimonadetes bacterium T265]
MCDALGVSVSGYNQARRRAAGPPPARAAADERLRVHVRAAHRGGRGCYGAPRVHRELRDAGVRDAGVRVARKRVARLMCEDGLVGRRTRRRVRTTDSAHAEPVAPNLLERRFGVADHPTPNAAWCGDLTYACGVPVPTREGWLFLSVLLDLSSRRVVGWATCDTLATAGPLAALRMALAARRPPPGLIHHTDRGSAYASRAYRAVLASSGMRPSMSRRGDCWDNAVAESFFSTLEHELLAGAAFATRAAAYRALAEFVAWYNAERRHSTLKYVSPLQYERQYKRQLADTRRAA